jgi:hypothetical protein
MEILSATVLLGQVCTFVLFVYLLVVYPFLSWLESYIYLNAKSCAARAGQSPGTN